MSIVTKTGDNEYTRESSTAAGVRDIPGYATWTEAEMTAWIETNVTDLASAKTAIIAMAKMITLMRDKLWPDITG